ncbi:ATP-binding protein [Streptomyces mayteni]
MPEVRSYRFVAPNTADVARLARDHVAWLLARSPCPVEVETVRLLVSEVVTNAYQHTSSPHVALTTTLQPGRVRVGVFDNSRRLVGAPAGGDVYGEGGRGLLLLQELSSRWGCELHGSRRPFGKSVWFELGSPPVSRR